MPNMQMQFVVGDVIRCVGECRAKHQLAYVYALRDPENTHVKYIGSTVDPRKRYMSHISEAEKLSGGDAKGKWILELRISNLFPVMQILWVGKESEVLVAEQREYDFYHSVYGLLNARRPSEGGRRTNASLGLLEAGK